MKQETGKKRNGWIWLVVAAAVVLLAVAGILLFPLLQPDQPQSSGEGTTSEIYWNLDRAEFTQNSDFGFTDRQPGEDGLFRIRFLAAGQLVEHITADRRLVNYIDTQSVMGLVFDADGMIADVLEISTFAERTAEEFYISSVNAASLTLNSSFAMNGMNMTIEIPDGVYIMDARPDSDTVGQRPELGTMDRISVYSKDGVVSAIFMTQRPPQADIYFRLNQKFDSKTGQTTRTPDENGAYTFQFAHEGEQVSLKCRDLAIANKIDAASVSAEMIMGLLFDEEGYIIDTVNAAMALRGKLLCDVYNITQIDGDYYTAERLMPGGDQGKTVEFRINAETDIFSADNGCVYEVAGQRVDQLAVMDRIACWTDVENNAKLIILYRRMVDSPMFYNTTVMYANGGTSRTPDASGYYVYEMASNGRAYTLKTKDKKIADRIDSNGNQAMGLELEGSVITRYYDPGCVCGGSFAGKNRLVGTCMGTVVTLINGGNFVVAADAQIYNVTGEYGVKFGSVTTLQQYDSVIAYRNVRGEISHAFVTSRYHENTKLYWNLTRKYDATKRETTRTPDADGYYVYEMLCDGKAVTVKTNNKALASIIDEQNAPVVALVVSGGIVKQAYPAISGVTYGTKTYNYNNVDSIDADGTVNCYYLSNGVKTAATAKYKLTDKTKIYNVSDNYINTRGERTTLQVDDRIQGIVNLETEELEYVFIIERMIDSPFYWSAKRMYNSTTGETTRQPNEEGYYTVDLAVNGTCKTFKTKNKALMSAVDAQTGAFAMRTDGDVILRVIRASSVRGIPSSPVGYADVMKISSGKITTVRNRPGASDYGTTTELTLAKDCKIYNVSSYAENFGAATKLEIGDRIVGYADLTGALRCIFIVRENTHADGCISLCEHCGKKVWWEPFDGSIYEADAHYYVPGDLTFTQKAVGNADETKPKYDIVLDLNGKTLTGTTRNFVVYAKLSILDTVGGGVLQAPGAGGFGGNIMCTRGGTVNVYGGTIRQTEGAPVSISGGNIHANNSTVNIYGGTLSGGVATSGGSVYVMGSSTLTVTGGTIKDGTVELVGNNSIGATFAGGRIESETLIASGSVLALSGNPEITGIVQVAPGGKLDISKLSADARISVLASGIFTTERDDIAAFKNCLLPAVSTCTIDVEGKALCAKVETPAMTDDLIFMEGTAKAVCPVCQAFTTWTAITGADTALTPASGSHYYLPEDVTVNAADNGKDGFLTVSLSNWQTGGAICVHLNGHNLTVNGQRTFMVAQGALNVMGNGIVSGDFSSGSTIHINGSKASGTANLYAGTFTKPAANRNGNIVCIGGNGGTVNMYDDATIDGGKNANTNSPTCVRILGSSGGTHSGNAVFNMYGGTIKDGVNATGAGGNIKLDTPYAAFNLYGGTVTGGKTETQDSGNIYALGAVTIAGGTIENGTVRVEDTNPEKGFANTLTITGGNLKCSIFPGETVTTRLSDSPMITGVLQVAAGSKLDISKLSTDARINVLASGVFTTERDDIALYKDCLLPAVSACAISVDGKALCASMSIPEVTENLEFVYGTTSAVCPACQTFVNWTAISAADTALAPVSGAHYYLAENTTVNAANGKDGFFTVSLGNWQSGGAICFHLNGHDLTVTGNRAFMVAMGTLNVMGNGTVSGDFSAGSTVHVNGSRASGIANLASGTFTKPATNKNGTIICIGGNGGTVNMGPYAVIDGRNNANPTSPTCVRLLGSSGGTHSGNAVFNMYGGTIKDGGNAAGTGGNIKLDTPYAFFNMYDGTISGGSTETQNCGIYALGNVTIEGGTISGGSMELLENSTLNIRGGKLDCGIFPANSVKIELSGDPEISGHGLDLLSGAKVTLGEMTQGASITVRAEGVFTETCAKAADYCGYFFAADGYLPVEAVDNTLRTAVDTTPSIPKVDNKPLNFGEGTTDARCPYCKTVVTWTAIAETDTALTPASGSHYYLPEDVTVNAANGKDGFLTVSLSNWQSGGAICLHLNEHALTVTGNRAFMIAQGTLNIMGNGSVSGDFSAGSTVHVNGSKASGTANLFGGIFQKPATNLNGNIVCIGGNGGTVNLYNDATIDGGNITNTSSPTCVRILGSTGGTHSGNAVFNMYSGTIKDGANSTGSGGNVKLDTAYATFNMYGGTISGGRAETQYGGNIYAQGDVNIQGGTISGGYAKMGGNIAMWEADLIVKDAIISGGHALSHGGNISLDLANLSIQGQADIKEGYADGQGGNVRAYKSSVTMESGSISKGSCATAYNHNLWLVGDSSVTSVLRMSGGTIFAQENTTKYATGIHAGTYAKVYLSGDASIVDHAETTGAGVYIGTTGKLYICNGWSGSASVRWASKYTAGQTVPVANAQVVTLDAELQETAGGTFTGTLLHRFENLLSLLPQADGTLKLSEEA